MGYNLISYTLILLYSMGSAAEAVAFKFVEDLAASGLYWAKQEPRKKNLPLRFFTKVSHPTNVPYIMGLTPSRAST